MKTETINEELNKFKLLMNYDTRKTLSENTFKLINELAVSAEIEALLKGSEAEVAASIAKGFEKGLLKDMETEAGVALKSTEEIVGALKAGTLTANATSKLTTALFKQGSTEAIRAAAADAITTTEGFVKKYNNMTKQEMLSELKRAKYNKAEAERLINSFEKNGGELRAEVPGQSTVKSTEKVTTTGEKSPETVTKTSDGIVIKGDNNIVYYSNNGSELKIVNSETNETLNIVKGEKIKRKYVCTVRLNCKTGTGVELTATELPAVETMSTMETMSQKLKDIAKKAVTSKWNWKRIRNWALAIGIGGSLLWWYFATHNNPVPDDIPTTPPDDNDNNNDGGNDDGIYTTPGDPYQYKVVDCVWFTKSLEQRGKIISDWTSLANNQKAIGILDGRFPEARQNCNGNTSSTTTPTTNDTLTPSGTTLNQQYGTEPMANAQPEVQTTNDDINNY